jgi:hypothetical protein
MTSTNEVTSPNEMQLLSDAPDEDDRVVQQTYRA